MRRMLDFALKQQEGGDGDMPVKSKAQSKALNAKFGHKWVTKHHFGGSTKGLPQHKKSSSKKK